MTAEVCCAHRRRHLANSGTQLVIRRISPRHTALHELTLLTLKHQHLAHFRHAGVAFLSFDVYDTPPVHALPLARSAVGADTFDEEGNPLTGEGTLDELEAVLAPEAAAASAAAAAGAAANGALGEAPAKGVTLLGGLVDSKSKVGLGCVSRSSIRRQLWSSANALKLGKLVRRHKCTSAAC